MNGSRIAYSVSICVLCGVVLGLASTANAGDAKIEKLARQVVGTSVGVKPGDVVVVAGGKHTIELMEAVATEVLQRGGMPTLFLSTDRVARARFAEMPGKYLDQEPKYFASWLEHIDVWISVPAFENPKAVWADIPQERMAKNQKAWQGVMDLLNDAKIRFASIGYPSAEEARINGLDPATYEAMHWKAVNTDYHRISEKGNYLRDVLKGSRTIKISSPAGTNLMLNLGDRPIFVDDGIVTEQEAKSNLFLTRIASRPGGSLFFAPIENSVQGKVVIPKHRCKFEPLTGVTFELRNGNLEDFKAQRGGECFENTMAAYTGPKNTFGQVTIGLNPEWKVIEDRGDFRPQDASGMVTIEIGNNELVGGNNHDTGSFSFPIVKATVEVDGRVVIKDGNLMF